VIYDQYKWKPEYEGMPCTYGGFAIIPGVVEDRPAVCIKQRNGQGSSRYLFDLPGGGMRTDPSADAVDPNLACATEREAMEEVKCRVTVGPAIGPPLYLPIKKDDRLVKVDCAQAFLVETRDSPTTSEEALSVAFVNQHSFAGFSVVGRKADPASPVFGRTPIMIFDGLSILQQPFWTGYLTDQISQSISGDHRTSDFVLVDGGVYFGRTRDNQFSLYYRLNPDQPGGRFYGAFEHLANA